MDRLSLGDPAEHRRVVVRAAEIGIPAVKGADRVQYAVASVRRSKSFPSESDRSPQRRSSCRADRRSSRSTPTRRSAPRRRRGDRRSRGHRRVRSRCGHARCVPGRTRESRDRSALGRRGATPTPPQPPRALPGAPRNGRGSAASERASRRDHPGGGERDRAAAVGRAVVDEDDLCVEVTVVQCGQKRGNCLRQMLRLVEDGHYDAEGGHDGPSGTTAVHGRTASSRERPASCAPDEVGGLTPRPMPCDDDVRRRVVRGRTAPISVERLGIVAAVAKRNCILDAPAPREYCRGVRMITRDDRATVRRVQTRRSQRRLHRRRKLDSDVRVGNSRRRTGSPAARAAQPRSATPRSSARREVDPSDVSRSAARDSGRSPQQPQPASRSLRPLRGRETSDPASRARVCWTSWLRSRTRAILRRCLLA